MALKQPPWDSASIWAVCEVLAQTDYPGLTWTTIERLLPEAGVREITQESSKLKKLHATLVNTQYNQQAGNCIIAFINAAMKPARYVNSPGQFEMLRDGLNEAMAFKGFKVLEDGRVAKGAVAKTLSQAAELAGRLQAELERRRVHPEVIRYCSEELVRKSLFHAMFEACKGLAQRIRDMTGLTSDGAALIDAAFSTASGNPILRINLFSTEMEKSDHKGLGNLIRGVFGTFRNDSAHMPRLTRTVNEDDALDLFSILSYIHRRLDQVP